MKLWDHNNINPGNRFVLRVVNDDYPRSDPTQPQLYYYISDDLVTDEAGKWVSFVIQFHYDETLVSGNGFIKVWKSEGVAVSGQCRGFTTDPQVSFTGGIGETPRPTGYYGLNVNFPRVYKGGWKTEDPLQAGPIEIFFDAYYHGPDSTTDFEDVNPCQLSVGSAVY